jgi:aminopeptidase-like protein
MNIGIEMHNWAKDLWPINRSLTGDGVRETLNYLKNIIPNLKILSVPSGAVAFDWKVPNEWNIREAYIEDEYGNKVVNFHDNNLHVVGYSESVDQWMTLEELNSHLYSLPDQPQAIPYVTSYYEKRWGFCISHEQKILLKSGKYHVVIDSSLGFGELNFAELVLEGRESTEVLLSTYICHPSMANNELSGPVVTAGLVRWLTSLKDRKHTYRIVFIPETIGSIVYINKNFEHLKKSTIAGYNITCVGDERCYSYLPSRQGDTLSDRAAVQSLKYIDPQFKLYTWLDRGSDERQYCAPGVDLPIATIMRSKYGEYPEYHTSLDDLDLVTPQGLEGGYNAIKNAIEIIEKNSYYVCNTICEPQLGKRGLYPNISTKNIDKKVKNMMNLISYCDGKHSLLDIAEITNIPFSDLHLISSELLDAKVISLINSGSYE